MQIQVQVVFEGTLAGKVAPPRTVKCGQSCYSVHFLYMKQQTHIQEILAMDVSPFPWIQAESPISTNLFWVLYPL